MIVQDGGFILAIFFPIFLLPFFAFKSLWIKLHEKVSRSKTYCKVQTIQYNVTEKCLPYWTVLTFLCSISETYFYLLICPQKHICLSYLFCQWQHTESKKKKKFCTFFITTFQKSFLISTFTLTADSIPWYGCTLWVIEIQFL